VEPVPGEVVAIGSSLALYFTGVLTLNRALAGFGDPAVILIAALIVVSEGLDATEVTTWIGQVLADRSSAVAALLRSRPNATVSTNRATSSAGGRRRRRRPGRGSGRRVAHIWAC